MLPECKQIVFKAYNPEFCGLVFCLGLGRWQNGGNSEYQNIEECVKALAKVTIPTGWNEVAYGLWEYADDKQVIAQVQFEPSVANWVIFYNGIKQIQQFPEFELAKLFVEQGFVARKARSEEILVVERHEHNKYIVHNHTNGNYYVVSPGEVDPRERCECGDAYFRGACCKHQMVVSEFKKQEEESMKFGEGDIILANSSCVDEKQEILLVKKVNDVDTDFESYTVQSLNLKFKPISKKFKCVHSEKVIDLILDKTEVAAMLPLLLEPSLDLEFLPLDLCEAEYEVRLKGKVFARVEHDMFWGSNWLVRANGGNKKFPDKQSAFEFVEKFIKFGVSV